MTVDVTAKTVEPTPTAVVAAATTWAEFPQAWGPMLDQVWSFLRGDASDGLYQQGHNIMLYQDDVPNVEVGVQVTGSFSPAGRVVASTLPGGLVATATHTGPIAAIGATHQAVREWSKANGYRLAGPRWEIYGDPDPATGDFEVDVFWSLVIWLPADFRYPTVVPVGDGHHLRPIRAADVELDYPAVMGSQPRLWSIFGEAWGWPPASMTYQQDLADLTRHEAEIAARQSFNYALLDNAENALLGCVYIDPPEKQGADAEISWWVVDGQAGTGLERELDALVPRWIAAAWPFTHPRYIGRDLSWAQWHTLPDIDPPAGQTPAT